MNVLLTGATGFVGRQLLRGLAASGCEIHLLSRNPVENYTTIQCNFVQDPIPPCAFDSVDTVFHLAGYAHDLRDATMVEQLYRAVNVEATIRLAELAVQKGVKRFIFVSSVKAGGSAVDGLCMTEKDQGDPEGIYGKTKREAEIKLLEISKQSGMHVSIVRPSLVYGPGVKGNLRMMLSGIEKGWFPPLPEVRNRRSMIHVDDLVQALLLVANDDRANGEIFIATDGHPYSSREIYETMCYMLGKSVPKWSVPKFIINLAAVMNTRVRYKVNKLMGDECYSSEKLQAIGFKARRLLRDMNETVF
ncbi:NAD-dependent epimerase/dehydratase family protein [Pseudomonadota bacterium]